MTSMNEIYNSLIWELNLPDYLLTIAFDNGALKIKGGYS